MNLNKAQLIGRVTQDIDLKTTPSGKSVCTFSIATNQVWKDQSGQKKEKTDFHNIVAWDKQAELISQHVVKGQELYVEGKIETRTWESDDGKKNYRTEVKLDQFQFGNKPGEVKSETKVNPHYDKSKEIEYPADDIDPDDIPF